METLVTATELSRNLSDILNRVRYKGERFRVVRNGEVIATLEPSPPEERKVTWADFIELLKNLPRPDDRFADDLEEIHKSQGTLPPIPEWPS